MSVDGMAWDVPDTAGFSRGSATRDCADLPVHRREERGVRGRTDLPGAVGARYCDRPAHLLGAPVRRAGETRIVGYRGHRDPGRNLRTGREWPPPAGVAVWHGEDVGAPEPAGHPGGQVHRGAAQARPGLAWGHAGDGRSALPLLTRPRAGHWAWCAASSRPPGPASCTWPASPTFRWLAAG